jgi:4-hydroxy-tetrahydrodipicolinate synthase
MKIPGIIVPPLTPFTADLKVDYDVLAREIDYIIEDCDAAAISAAGVETSEYHYLEFDARKELIRRTAEIVGRRRPLIVGVSHPAVRSALELAELAAKVGAEAIQVLAPLRPFGGAPTQSDLMRYFEAILRDSPLPIVLYLNPGPGAEVPPDWVVALTKLEGIKYVKESSRDLSRVSRLIVEVDLAGHARYFTTMQMLLATIELGGSGATMPPPGCKIADEILKAFAAGDRVRAAELQRQFALFPAKWQGKGLAPAMKAAMEIVGLSLGDPYPPFQPLSAEEKASMAAHLKTTCLFEGDRAPDRRKASAA